MATNINLNEGHFFVSVGGNRLKQHQGNTVYLDNGREFQLEVFNPTTSKVLAKIKINGEYISTSGLVLKPGQRVFLERYFDIAKKFKYETYTVDNSPATAAAIVNNGLVEIEFYKEHIPTPTYTTICNPTTIITNPPWWQWNHPTYYSSGSGCYGTTNDFNINLCGSVTNGGTNISSTPTSGSDYKNMSSQSSAKQSNFDGKLRSQKRDIVNTSYLSDDSASASFTSSVGNSNSVTLDSLDFMETNFERTVSEPLTKETGRVEAGSYSNQSFVTDYATYNSYYSSKVTWKILPASQKPLEVSDLKVFCSQCGAQKKRPNWIYCPSCSSKFE